MSVYRTTSKKSSFKRTGTKHNSCRPFQGQKPFLCVYLSRINRWNSLIQFAGLTIKDTTLCILKPVKVVLELINVCLMEENRLPQARHWAQAQRAPINPAGQKYPAGQSQPNPGTPSLGLAASGNNKPRITQDRGVLTGKLDEPIIPPPPHTHRQ